MYSLRLIPTTPKEKLWVRTFSGEEGTVILRKFWNCSIKGTESHSVMFEHSAAPLRAQYFKFFQIYYHFQSELLTC
jgi:hypothetical protein